MDIESSSQVLGASAKYLAKAVVRTTPHSTQACLCPCLHGILSSDTYDESELSTAMACGMLFAPDIQALLPCLYRQHADAASIAGHAIT